MAAVVRRAGRLLPLRLVFLHGFPLNGRMWREQMQTAPGATVAPDLYAMGDSMEGWAQGVLATQPDGPLILVGSSMGGSCALEMARLAGRFAPNEHLAPGAQPRHQLVNPAAGRSAGTRGR